MIFRVKYLDWNHKVQTISILASDEKNAEKEVSSMKDVKVILNIEEEEVE